MDGFDKRKGLGVVACPFGYRGFMLGAEPRFVVAPPLQAVVDGGGTAMAEVRDLPHGQPSEQHLIPFRVP